MNAERTPWAITNAEAVEGEEQKAGEKAEEREAAAETTYKMHNSERTQNAPIVTMETFLQLYCSIPEKEKGKGEKQTSEHINHNKNRNNNA